jgi:hypothetical protein
LNIEEFIFAKNAPHKFSHQRKVRALDSVNEDLGPVVIISKLASAFMKLIAGLGLIF